MNAKMSGENLKKKQDVYRVSTSLSQIFINDAGDFNKHSHTLGTPPSWRQILIPAPYACWASFLASNGVQGKKNWNFRVEKLSRHHLNMVCPKSY